MLIVTMENGENEFDECLKIIKEQKNVNFEHIVISGRTEFEAHMELNQIWNSQRKNFNLLIKIDADSILREKESLEKISSLFEYSEITGAQLKMHDYYSNDLIAGLNAFSNRVTFTNPKSRLRPDNVDIGHQVVLKGASVEHLEPIAWHCKYPSIKQSFIYGFHRTLKNQHFIMRKVAEQWILENDEARKWALIGAFQARKKRYLKYIYSSETAYRIFEATKKSEINHYKILRYAQKLTFNKGSST